MSGVNTESPGLRRDQKRLCDLDPVIGERIALVTSMVGRTFANHVAPVNGAPFHGTIQAQTGACVVI